MAHLSGVKRYPIVGVASNSLTIGEMARCNGMLQKNSSRRRRSIPGRSWLRVKFDELVSQSTPTILSAARNWQSFCSLGAQIGPGVLCLFAFFRGCRSLDNSHRVLVQIANLRGLLEFGGSCNGIEAA